MLNLKHHCEWVHGSHNKTTTENNSELFRAVQTDTLGAQY